MKTIWECCEEAPRSRYSEEKGLIFLSMKSVSENEGDVIVDYSIDYVGKILKNTGHYDYFTAVYHYGFFQKKPIIRSNENYRFYLLDLKKIERKVK